MADKQKTKANEATNGTKASAEAEGQPNEQAQEIAAAYERARQELGEAMTRLRTEMAKLDLQQAGTRARNWVEENPTLAVFLGVGAGVLVGRFLASAFTPPPPPTLTEKARLRARSLASQAGRYSHDFGDYVVGTGGQIRRRVAETADVAAHRAAELGDDLADLAEELSESLGERAEELGETISKAALAAAATLEGTAHDTSKTLKKKYKTTSKDVSKKVDRGVDFADSLASAAKTAIAAVVVKKVNDWIKMVR